MFNANFLRLFRLDSSRNVQERLARFCPVLLEMSAEKRCPTIPKTHVFNLLDGKICIRWNTNDLWAHIHDDHHWLRDVALQKFVDFEVRRAQLRSGVVPPNHPLAS